MDTTTNRIAIPPRTSARQVTQAEFDAAVLEHHLWLSSGGSKGRRLCFRDCDLNGLEMAELNLRDADFRRANLQFVHLSGARLRGADLAHADLRGARLAHTELRETDLGGADLTGTRGLLSGQFGGAILIDTKLPEGVACFEGVNAATEASSNAQSLFTTLMLASAYVWLTIASTTDAQLLNNAAPPSAKLPILGIDIPLVRFYVASPILLLSLYIYFHLGLQRLWEELADLPAVFPDGRPLDKRVAPWLMNSLVSCHFVRLRQKRKHMNEWQARIATLLAWGVIPLTLGLIWVRYLRAHDWSITGVHIVLLAVSVGLAAGMRRLASATLDGLEHREFVWKRVYRDSRTLFAIVSVLFTFSLFGISYGSIHGFDSSEAHSDRGVIVPEKFGFDKFDIRWWGPHLMDRMGYSPFAQLDGVDVSTKPAVWHAAPAERDFQDIAGVKGADLGGRNLRSAKAYGAFFVNAYLKLADLQDSDLREADLRCADLREASLDRANLRGADLSKADLRWVSAVGAKFKEVKLSGAMLDDACLKNANLQNATAASINGRVTSFEAVNFEGADLTGANFSGANCKGAFFLNTILVRTDLRGADLSDAIGLQTSQLALALTDENTVLPGRRPQIAEKHDNDSRNR